MLQSLQVRNLALIDHVEIEFTRGLNIMSGETGAGKSIIIGSMNVALGEKAAKEMLRNKEEMGYVELVFHVDKEEQIRKLEEMDIFLEDGCVILSRRITGNRSISKINGETVPVSKVKQVASILIDIHGQHEHQSLLQKKNHIQILDQYAKNALSEPKQELRELYSSYQSIRQELEEASMDEEERQREISFLEFEINELVEANLKIGEDEELEMLYKKMTNSKKILDALGKGYEYTGNGYESAADKVSYAIRELSFVAGYDKRMESLASQLSDIENLLNDFNRELSDCMADSTFEESDFRETEERLDLINRLKNKHGDSIEKILEALKEKQKRVEKLTDYDVYLAQLKEKYDTICARLEEKSQEISMIRKEAAAELTTRIIAQLEDLNFLNVSFSIDFKDLDYFTVNGMDEVEFMISTNPGEKEKSLEKIASGGELSRIMLAIKTVFADADEIDTLIFDEIDAGISGRTAQKVSEKMDVIGRAHQIICITHLPQIASMADTHFLIEKSIKNDTTTSTIRALNQEESIIELARMLGGAKITDTTLKSAGEMKELAHSIKESQVR